VRDLAHGSEAATLDGVKRRARRVTIAAAILGAGVVGVFVALHWATVRDHVEAWRFQLAGEMETIKPDPRVKTIPMHQGSFSFPFLLHILAAYSDCPVIFGSDDNGLIVTMNLASRNALPHRARDEVQARGFRVLEQRFPRHAYVVIRDEGATR
jgi:hypothetical protein